MGEVAPVLWAAQRRAIMNDIVIESPRLRGAHRAFDFLVELGRLEPRHEKRCVALIGPSQSGKTTIINSYAVSLNRPEATREGDIPALIVTLEANITRRQFAQNILAGFERFGFNALSGAGTEVQLLERVAIYLVARKVRVLFLDEFHHLVHSDNERVIKGVSEAVKSLLLRGSCPIVVAGLPHARKPFDSNIQLAHRAEAHLELRPLDPASGNDKELFKTFLSDYLVRADQLGAGGNLASLLGTNIPACLWEVSQGVLGGACNLVKDAVQLAALDNRWNVSHCDLVAATDHFIAKKLYHRNPFREGLAAIRPLERA